GYESARILARGFHVRSTPAPRDLVGAVVEDPLDVATNNQGVCQPAESAAGKRVAHDVLDPGLVAGVLEVVGVVPETIWPAELHVDKSATCGPFLDPCQPRDPNDAPADRVFDQRADFHPDRCGSDDAKVQPRRREQIQVVGVSEELKYVCNWTENTLAAV